MDVLQLVLTILLAAGGYSDETAMQDVQVGKGSARVAVTSYVFDSGERVTVLQLECRGGDATWLSRPFFLKHGSTGASFGLTRDGRVHVGYQDQPNFVPPCGEGL